MTGSRRVVYIYNEVLREFSLLTMDPMPTPAPTETENSMKLRNRTVELSLPIEDQRSTEKRHMNEPEEDLPSPKRLKRSVTPPLEEVIVDVPGKLTGDPKDAVVIVEPGQVSPVSEAGSVTLIHDVSLAANMEEMINQKKDSDSSKAGFNDILEEALEDRRKWRSPI